MRKRTPFREVASPTESGSGGITGDPLAVYGALLLLGLAGTFMAQVVVSFLLPQFNAEALSQPLNTVLALVYGWILAGLSVCVLLYAWLTLRAAGIAASVIGVLAWFLGLRGHLGSPSLALYLLPIAAGLVVLRQGLRYASQYLLPVANEDQAAKAFKLLRDYASGLGRPGRVVDSDGRVREVGPRSKQDDSSKKSRPAFFLTGCDHAVAIYGQFRLQGVRGPGLVFLSSDDEFGQPLDLRPQERSFSLAGLTRDGIEIRVRASVSFKIDGGRREPTLGEPLPFKRASAFKAVRAQRVEHQSDDQASRWVTERRWDHLPAIIGQQILRDAISRYSFDDLYGMDRLGGKPPRHAIASTLYEELESDLEPVGIQLIGVELGNLEPANPRVYVERARNWQTEWMRSIALKEAEGQAERVQILERARADTRADLIMDLGRQLEALAESRADLGAETVLGEFLELLGASTEPPERRPELSAETGQD